MSPPNQDAVLKLHDYMLHQHAEKMKGHDEAISELKKGHDNIVLELIQLKNEIVLAFQKLANKILIGAVILFAGLAGEKILGLTSKILALF